ncbi:Multifunctional conjugation protein TraI [Citrobacter amalonaticus]|nr:Multifunctional conjugation protein TraI [Citrobacter amalonaticus]
MKMQVTLGKIYRSALRQEVEALGHKVEEVGKHGMWELRACRRRCGKICPPVAGK